MMYLVEALSLCVRCLHVEAEFEIPAGQKRTPYELEDLGLQLTQRDNLLFMPMPNFIAKIFASCTKVRPLVHLTKCYMHWCYHDYNFADKLFDTVTFGLKNYDFDRLRPFLVLF